MQDCHLSKSRQAQDSKKIQAEKIIPTLTHPKNEMVAHKTYKCIVNKKLIKHHKI